MKKLILSLAGAGVLAGAFFFFLWADESPILIESRESQTADGKPVFNRIRRIAGPRGRVTWMMQQSHDGVNAPEAKWERLALMVDEGHAEYFQLANGPLFWPEKPASAPLRVACYLCHANGPRAIRPRFDSAAAPIAWKNYLRILLWNLSVKTAGRVSESPREAVKDATLRRGQNPFRYRGPFENEPLRAKTCTLCHREGGLFARGALTRQHFMAIRFLVGQHLMPPPGIPLSEGERAEVLRFAAGE